jgi:NAD+ synthase
MNMKDRIIQWLEKYKELTNCKGVVLGISGGKDSTVVAMLAKKVWGDNVFGVLMPNGTQSDLEDSLKVVNKLNIKYEIVNIQESYNAIISQIKHTKISDKSKTNIPPRLRMTTLYAIAQSIGYRVIGTGNASERTIGWTTKWGDSAYDFNPIACLTCTEVVKLGVELAKEFGLDETLVNKKPADGLTGKSDEDNFGFTYKQLDDWILLGTSGNNEIDDKIQLLRERGMHKQSMPKIFDPYINWPDEVPF